MSVRLISKPIFEERETFGSLRIAVFRKRKEIRRP
jgi:hypothetical protein